MCKESVLVPEDIVPGFPDVLCRSNHQISQISWLQRCFDTKINVFVSAIEKVSKSMNFGSATPDLCFVTSLPEPHIALRYRQ